MSVKGSSNSTPIPFESILTIFPFIIICSSESVREKVIESPWPTNKGSWVSIYNPLQLKFWIKSVQVQFWLELYTVIKVGFLWYFLFSRKLDCSHFSKAFRRFRACASGNLGMIPDIREYTSSLLILLFVIVLLFVLFEKVLNGFN